MSDNLRTTPVDGVRALTWDAWQDERIRWALALAVIALLVAGVALAVALRRPPESRAATLSCPACPSAPNCPVPPQCPTCPECPACPAPRERRR